MNAANKDVLLEAHQPHWKTFWIWLGFAAFFFLAEAVLFWTVDRRLYWLAIPMTLLVAHLMHSHLLAFHEAAHGVLCPNYWVNEVAGMIVANFHFNGLSLFRAVHETHHRYLGTERDEQLWPFVHTEVPRWRRILTAAFELCLGIVFDVIIFWRAFLRAGSPVTQLKVRRRIWVETAITAVYWSVIIGVVAWFGVWKWLLVLYVIPAVVAGNMHSFRKYIEHMGLTGSGINCLTRSVVPTTAFGRLVAFTMFNISYHSVHHHYGRMPEASLPKFAEVMRPTSPEDEPVYPSYWAAFRAMLPSLANPRIGPQWHSPAGRSPGLVGGGRVANVLPESCA